MARIRTIKPEFWRNEALSELPEFCHMLAAALLNYCDDHGYFNAHPRLVMAECMPLREPSMDTTVALRELSRIGYIRLGEGSDGRTYGHIVAFTKHQVINKPTKSKIADIPISWGSELPTTVVLPEDSHTERKGKEQGKERGTREAQGDFAATASPTMDEEPEPDPPEPPLMPPDPTNRERLLAATGADPISGLIGPNGRNLGSQANSAEAEKWTAMGLTIAEQIAVITERCAAVRAKNPHWTPGSMGYFTGAMADLAATKATKPPAGVARSNPANPSQRDSNRAFFQRVIASNPHAKGAA